jgi:hypothetical protein
MEMAETMAVPASRLQARDGRLVIDAWAGSVNERRPPGTVSRGEVLGSRRSRAGDRARWRRRLRRGTGVLRLQWLPLWVWSQAQIEVSVPPRYSVDVATSGGRVEIHGFDGEVEVRSV